MLKPLRHPTVFVLLTVSLFGWVFSWAGSIDLVQIDTNTDGVPLYRLVMHALDRPRDGSSAYPLSTKALVVRHPDGLRVVERPPPGTNTLPDGATAGSYVSALPTDRHGFGFISPLLLRERHVHYADEFWPGIPTVGEDEARAEALASGLLPRETEWTIRWPYAFHDSVLALTLLAWLYSFFTIPAWKLWRTLTPAQRRRMRSACPNCSYDRSATPTAPCPECGHASS